MSIVPEARRTVWNPGIYGGIPPDNAVLGTFPNGVGPATQYGSTLSPGANIQAALDAAGAVATKASRRFVQLGAGTFNTGSLSIPSYVILRGTLGANNTRQTKLNQTNGPNTFISIGGGSGATWGSVISATGTQAKGADTITVSNASEFSVGDIIKIDQISDGLQNGPTDANFQRNPSSATGSYVAWNSSLYYNRQSYSFGIINPDQFPDASGEQRHITQTCEILAINGNDLTIHDQASDSPGAPLHMTFYNSPEVYRVAGVGSVSEYAGVEDLALWPAGTDGKESIVMQQAAFCWAKNVESSGDFAETGNTWSGTHLQMLWHTYRCEFEGCYVHHSSNYYPGGNAYGILWAGSENLIHNNVAVLLNKAMFAENSGGGCVVAYNYTDGATNAALSGFSETGICTHASFCNYDLFEGNRAVNITIDSTHGNNDKEVIFRNHCYGENTIGDTLTGYMRAISSDGWSWDVTSIGNILWHPGRTGASIEAVFASGGANNWEDISVYLCGSNCWEIPSGNEPGAVQSADDGMALENFYRNADYEYKTQAQYTNPADPTSVLPDSLYLTSAPDYFSGYTWPPFNPAGANDSERIGTLPAKARYDAGEA